MHPQLQKLRNAYALCKNACQLDSSGDLAGGSLKQLVHLALRFLEQKCKRVELVSRVEGKQYVAFRRKDESKGLSRPANVALFQCSARTVAAQWDEWIKGSLPEAELARMSYTIALAPCLALELFDRQNKKGPATFFESMVGHVMGRTFRCNPERKATLDVEGVKTKMTMDFLFHLPKSLRIHVAVKMSTRERVVQAWAHQRILDSAYGQGAYQGMMVLFGETKLDSRSLEVVEICVPDQWLVYQSLLSRMERIFYFDMPQRYAALAVEHPTVIKIEPFVKFFTEKDRLFGRKFRI